ncbi:MAG TPA: glycosyltransferase [Acetobacteraceae bacterium]|nr:glycosyltransferase [Acetobacteraceae bacterium]
MKIAYFTHSLRSCWNHGNAHFLRGVLRALIALGHEAVAFEPQHGWSMANLLRDHGEAAILPFQRAYPELVSLFYDTADDPAELCDGADVVIVHEWNDPALVQRIGHLRRGGAAFTLLFHDTHHRAVSDPNAVRAFDLNGYDGVLAFGASLSEVYRTWGWADRVFVWHEAADITLFRPPSNDALRAGLVWIGNWGDGERSAELTNYLLRPSRRAELNLDIHGVRYPREAFDALTSFGAVYRGWLANVAVPGVFARYLATVHVPRRFYVDALPGIPTIRVFEALACGIPLVSAPWNDAEGLFREGSDYLVGRNEAEMARHLLALQAEPEQRASLVSHGLETIRARHTCAHRANELLEIDRQIRSSGIKAAAQ